MIIIILAIVFLIGTSAFFLKGKTPISKESKSRSSQSVSVESTIDSKTEPVLPTRADLEKQLSTAFEDLGSCQVITVHYEDKNQATLENAQGVKVQSSLSLESVSDLTFTLNDIKPPLKNVKVGDTVSLIRAHGILHAYRQD